MSLFPTPDPHAMTPQNLWVAVYRDRMRGGVGYEFLLAPPGHAGREVLAQDPSTLVGLPLEELEKTLTTVAQSSPIMAPGFFNWLPTGMQQYLVWVSQRGQVLVRLVHARSSDTAAAAAAAELGGSTVAVNELSQVQSIVEEMRDILSNKRYEKLLNDYRPEAVDGEVRWLNLKKNPRLARAVMLMRQLEEADREGRKAPEVATELIAYWKQLAPGQPSLVADYICWAEKHLG